MSYLSDGRTRPGLFRGYLQLVLLTVFVCSCWFFAGWLFWEAWKWAT